MQLSVKHQKNDSDDDVTESAAASVQHPVVIAKVSQ